MKERNVDSGYYKGKSPKQELTNAKDLVELVRQSIQFCCNIF